jgi:hypothetical protein
MPEVVEWPIDRVHPNTWNPNVVPEHTMQALKANVTKMGFNAVLLVRPHPVDGAGALVGEKGAGVSDTDVQIVDGEHRYRTALAEGYTHVPVIVRAFTDAEAKTQTIAMNKLRGEMDPADVARLVRENAEDGLELAEMATYTGYTEAELEAGQRLLEFDWSSLGPAPTDGDTPPEPDDRWLDLKFRAPQAVADIVNGELDRLMQHLGYDESQRDTHLHFALELMAVTSANTPEGQL